MNELRVTDVSHAAFCSTGTSLHTILTGHPTAELAHTTRESAKFSPTPTPGTVAPTRWHYTCLQNIFTELKFQK